MASTVKLFARLLTAAFFIALLLRPALAVVTTTAVPCVTTWTDLGTGPMIVQTATSACVIAVADTTPGASLAGFHLGSVVPYSYTGSSHLWARGSGSVVIAK